MSIKPLQPADFTPEVGNYKTLRPFRYWCQKVLPLVYDDSLSYYELLCKVVDYLNKTMEDVETLHGDVTNLHKAYEELQEYVNNYFATLDVQEEINNKLDNMSSDGTLSDLIKPFINVPTLKIANSISEMTDVTAYYVLTTDNHVYSYNGTSWVDSGLNYSAIDTSFIGYRAYINTSETVNLDNIPINTSTVFSCDSTYVTNSPVSGILSGNLLTFNYTTDDVGGKLQLFYDNLVNKIYSRIYWNHPTTWSKWSSFSANKALTSSAISGTGAINTYTDFDTMPYNSVCSTAGDFTKISNAPGESIEPNAYFTVITASREEGTSKTNNSGCVQYAIHMTTHNLYVRLRYGNTADWQEWSQILPSNIVSLLQNKGVFTANKAYINTSETVNLDNIPINTSTVFSCDSTYVTNSPVSGILSGNLLTFNYTTDDVGGKLQLFYDNLVNKIYSRIYWNHPTTWSKWSSFSANKALTSSAISGTGAINTYTDFDTMPYNSVCSTAGDFTKISNAPGESIEPNAYFTVITASREEGTSKTNNSGCVQYAIHMTTHNLYVRLRYGNTADWQEWSQIGWKKPTIPDGYYAYKGLGNFTVCGDSLSVSLVYPNGIATESKSWGKYFANDIFKTCNVFAQGGITSIGYKESDLLLNAVADTSDFAFIYLGTNDSNENTDIGTSDDIGTNTNSFYGAYSYIINQLLTTHKFVFCITISESTQHKANRNDYNKAIKTICDSIDRAFLVDIEDYNSILSPYVYYGHYTPIGYANFAGVIEQACSKTMCENIWFSNYIGM